MIDDALAAFLQQGLAINIGTRNARLEPNAAYVPAVVVESGGTHLVVYVPQVGADRVLADLESNGQAALVFARPQDDRACQVKGTVVSVREAAADERPVVDSQYQGFMRQLEMIGMPGESTRPWITWPCHAVRLKVTALYSQTPGPDAGAPLS
jgi:Pyridoxamine 5'-phosphate oxidase